MVTHRAAVRPQTPEGTACELTEAVPYSRGDGLRFFVDIRPAGPAIGRLGERAGRPSRYCVKSSHRGRHRCHTKQSAQN